ncbi:uncharacterized protein [Cicer arietinum]|uniref:Protein DEHYDRATION-INDUCED 19 homolog 2-like isoform X1 n=1 Tax=Cicer arietinum TaxID=3827 RepID=A0A1S3E8K5_CICAR|nr:protein DEHYDRATION-INDUCED 19 homolog 2-like isoform X1 [Cicer arietinum]
MTNCTENNNNVSSSSSPTPTEVPESFSAFENLVALKRELAELNQGIRSYVYRRGRRVIENWGPPRFFIPNNALEDNISMSGDEKDNYSVYNPTEVDDDSQSTVKCPVCDFDIEVAALRDRSEDGSYEAYSMICPVCDENLGERVMRIVQNASSRKRAWKSEKYSIWSGHAAMDDKKHASWGNNHEPMSGSLLSPAMDNVSAPNSNDFLSDDDTISNASDIPIAKSIAADAPEAPDSVDEQDVQERRVRAAVVQELVMSAMFLE